LVTDASTPGIVDYLKEGGRVLHLVSETRGAFQTEGTWFLRGTVWAPPNPSNILERVPGQLLQDLQLFELGGEAVLRGETLWDQVEPLLMFVETHDLRRVRPNFLLFACNVGRGKLVVSCLRHQEGREENYAGFWLARELLHFLWLGPPPVFSWKEETIAALRSSLYADILKVEGPWRFRKDPEKVGLKEGWEREAFDDDTWNSLSGGSREESEIWYGYDGWGWYRKTLKVPRSWKGQRVHIIFESVDDLYELYVNGEKAGGYGSLDRSESSYQQRTWVDLSEKLHFGRDNVLAVRVYDWVGAGGLNGKVWMTTGPVEKKWDLLRR